MDAPLANPLYHQWLAVADHGGGALALREPDGAREWSFSALCEAAEAAPSSPPLLHTTARGARLIVDVLRTWRDGTVLLADDGSGVPAPALKLLKPGVFHLKTTSGSTGAARHVQFRPQQLAADAAQIVSSMGLRTEWLNLGVVSMAHSYGFSNLVLPLLLHGIPLWLLDSPLPETLRRVFDTRQPLTLAAVPAMWQAWDRVGLEFGPVRLAISAGAPLPLALEQSVFSRCGLKIHNFYGSSECGGIAYDRSATPRSGAGLAGTAMDGVNLSRDEATGRLRIVSAAVGEGYAPNTVSFDGGGLAAGRMPAPPVARAFCPEPSPTLSRPKLTVLGYAPAGDADGEPGGGIWLAPDLVRLDGDATVWLLGRTGDSVSVAGHKVFPALIEEALLRVPGVRCCVVFGVPSANPIRVEDLVACVNLQPGTSPELLGTALDGLPSTYLPRHWWWRGDLTPDHRGKLSRHQWRQLWLREHATA